MIGTLVLMLSLVSLHIISKYYQSAILFKILFIKCNYFPHYHIIVMAFYAHKLYFYCLSKQQLKAKESQMWSLRVSVFALMATVSTEGSVMLSWTTVVSTLLLTLLHCCGSIQHRGPQVVNEAWATRTRLL